MRSLKADGKRTMGKHHLSLVIKSISSYISSFLIVVPRQHFPDWLILQTVFDLPHSGQAIHLVPRFFVRNTLRNKITDQVSDPVSRVSGLSHVEYC
jgi:hypothetical protein